MFSQYGNFKVLKNVDFYLQRGLQYLIIAQLLRKTQSMQRQNTGVLPIFLPLTF